MAVVEGQGPRERGASAHGVGPADGLSSTTSTSTCGIPDWGGAFLKTNAYAPWPVWIWLNGHDWAKRQCERLGIGYTALDNGFRDCEDPAALQRICDRLGSRRGEQLLLALAASGCPRRSPAPMCARVTSTSWRFASSRSPIPGCLTGRRRGDRFSSSSSATTSTWADPNRWRSSSTGGSAAAPRAPCAPRSSPGASIRSSAATTSSSRIKQYFKEHRALRTELVISDTRDFGIGRRVTAENWKALRAVGDAANRRLCDAQASDALPAPDVATFTQVTRPSHHRRPARPRTALRGPTGDGGHGRHRRLHPPARRLRQSHLVKLVATLLDQPYTSRQATYDLRRLKRKDLIVRLPGHPTATSSPHSADALPSCSPRPTAGSWPPALPPLTHAYLRNWFDDARWRLPGTNSTVH